MQALYCKNARSKGLLCFLLFMGTLTLFSCKEKKEPEEIVVDKVMDKPRTETQSMADENINGEMKWIGGARYTYSIERSADESLPKVENHDLEDYDNSVHRVIKRSDGTVFFDRSVTKKSLGDALPVEFRESGVLLGMNFEEASGNTVKYVVSVGSPDDSYDEFYYILMTINNYGNVSYSVHKNKRVG